MKTRAKNFDFTFLVRSIRFKNFLLTTESRKCIYFFRNILFCLIKKF